MRHFLLVLAACGSGGGGNAVDASKAIDASPDGRAHTGTAMSHTLFVNTEGVALTPGADDATTNKTDLITAMATLKSWRVGDAARVQKIMDVMGTLQTTLAPFDITIVNTRPAVGPYDMLVVTDDQPTALAPSFANVGAVTSTSCNAAGSVVSVVFPAINGSATDAQNKNDIVNLGIAMFGINNGIPLSDVANDCMCLAGTKCNALPQPCTIGGVGTTIDTGNSGVGECGDTDATMDEGAKFLAAFGSH